MNQDNQNNNTQVTNENNSQTTETSTYQIPGVIIPDQVTDSGEHLSTQPVQQTQTTPEKETPPQQETTVYQIPGVIIPEQTTENGKIETVNNVTEENIYKAPEKEVVNTAEKPLMPGMMPEKKVEEVKEKPKKVKKEGNAKIGCLTLLVFALLATTAYFGYMAYFHPVTYVSEDVKEINSRVYNKKGLVVQELYDRVNFSGCNYLYYNFYNGEKDLIKRTDLSGDFKIYMAYLKIKNTDVSSAKCSNYENALNSKGEDKKWYCGSDYLNSTSNTYNDVNDNTTIISSDVLKNQVEKMFGKGEYSPQTFGVSVDSRFFYDSSNEVYVLQTSSADKECHTFSTTLNNVSSNENEIILNVDVTISEYNGKLNKNVIFEKNKDGNYYFNRVTN